MGVTRYRPIDVISRTIIRSFIEEVRVRCVPVLHGLYWGFTLQSGLRKLVVVDGDIA